MSNVNLISVKFHVTLVTFSLSLKLQNNMSKKIIIVFAIFSSHCLAVTPSRGCNKPPPDVPFPGEAFKFVDIYNDKILGPTERSYIVYIPETYNADETNMLVIDMHGLHGSADGQSKGFWRQTAERKKNTIVVWPDGMHDSPNGIGSWNCSTTEGPLGHPCVIERTDWKKFECHFSCPTCDENYSCDWTSCSDDIGFVDFIQQKIIDTWCVDLDSMHLSGFSNGGIFAYYLASHATDALGFATINPVASSSLLGFGIPPEGIDIPFSILDMHGYQDQLIPTNEAMSVETGPYDSLLSVWGWYFDKKENLLDQWAQAMKCQDGEHVYQTPFDGEDELACYERYCANEKSIVRCVGQWAHSYPVPGKGWVSTEIAHHFMKANPRQ